MIVYLYMYIMYVSKRLKKLNVYLDIWIVYDLYEGNKL